jgi:hypothetical protein
MQSGQNAIIKKTPETPANSFHLQHIICIKSTPLFNKDEEYYCFADDGDYFWLHINHSKIGIDQLKITCDLKKHFKLSNFYLRR